MPAVNLDELNEIMDNDQELIQECLAEFLIDYPNLINGVKSAIENKSFEEIDGSAHKLKGTLRYLAAADAADAAQVIETAGRQQDLDGIEKKLAALEAECQKVILFIDGMAS